MTTRAAGASIAGASDRGNRHLRFLDRYLGIPLVFVLGSIKTKTSRVSDFSSIGLLMTAAIGDTILLAGVISDLRRAFPDKRIVLFTGHSNFEVACLLKGLDEVVRLPIRNPLRALRLLRRKRPDILCDFGPWPRINALFCVFSGSRCTVGFHTPRQYRHYAYDFIVDHSADVHEIENYRRLVRVLRVESTSPPTIDIAAPLIEGLEAKTYVVFHAWSGGYKGHLKEWPDNYWLDLARDVAALGFRIVLTGAPDDRERTQDLQAKLGRALEHRAINLAGKTTLAQTARVLREAAAVVSVNTGTMHLAAAVGGSVVALNGPVPEKRWGPLATQAVSVNAEEPGCAYLNLGFEYDNQREDCMALISPERVFRALRELISRSLSEPSPCLQPSESTPVETRLATILPT